MPHPPNLYNLIEPLRTVLANDTVSTTHSLMKIAILQKRYDRKLAEGHISWTSEFDPETDIYNLVTSTTVSEAVLALLQRAFVTHSGLADDQLLTKIGYFAEAWRRWHPLYMGFKDLLMVQGYLHQQCFMIAEVSSELYAFKTRVNSLTYRLM